MTTTKITIATEVERAIAERICERLALTDPDIGNREVTYEIDDELGLGVDCEDEILAAQIYRAISDALDRVES